MLVSEEKANKLLSNLNASVLKKLEKDPLYNLRKSLMELYGVQLKFAIQDINDKIELLQRTYMEGLREMDKDKLFYPDANQTLRLTYGAIEGYKPADGVSYKYYTTVEGIIQKDNPDIYDYDVPDKLKELYDKKDYGQYEENGTIVTCFISNNDITGGNSGSPVMNGKGELIGCAFDGNWEAMSGDISFEHQLQRTIVADIRYILFIVDKYAGAQNLIKEMDIRTN